jgi:uncharacterized lipoprotein YmbA
MRRVIGWGVITLLIAAATLTVVPARAAYADAPTQDGVRLENLLKREQIVLSNQQARLATTDQVIALAQDWITALKNEGKDTSALEAALGAYQSGVASARASFDAAKSILDAHAGFDAGGKVTNRAEALKTVVEAGRAERQFHLTITQATIDFRAAVRAYRQANR